MPTDKLRQPDLFPALFHYPLQTGLGEYFIAAGTKEHCKSAARKYRCFLRSLREYPLHPSLKQLEKHSVRTEVRQGIGEWFSLVVHVKGKLEIPGI
jgi:hypothetical protein